MLQISSNSKRGGNNAKPSSSRKRFLFAYERTYGNISASCEYAGISRQTYYRWKRSKSGVNLRFQKKIEQIRPVERKIDLAESKLMQLVEAGNVRAAIFLLKTYGKSRGWDAQPTSEQGTLDHPDCRQDFSEYRKKIEVRAADKGIDFLDEATSVLQNFRHLFPCEFIMELEADVKGLKHKCSKA